MRKFQKFFYDLLQTSRDLNVVKNIVKSTIGDSTDNNRTLSVNQVIRYLENNQIRNGRKLARKVRAVYSVLRTDILNDRKTTTRRTDAVDINELIDTYRAVVMNDGLKRQTVGRAVS